MNRVVAYFLRVSLLFLRFFSKLLLIIFSYNFCAKIVGIVFFVWVRFIMFLDGVCICLGCTNILKGLWLIFWCVLLLNYFFTTQSLLLICCCCVTAKNCRCRFLSVGRVFLLLLLHFCFCLGCVDILTGTALICDVFCCLFNFFWPKHYS